MTSFRVVDVICISPECNSNYDAFHFFPIHIFFVGNSPKYIFCALLGNRILCALRNRISNTEAFSKLSASTTKGAYNIVLLVHFRESPDGPGYLRIPDEFFHTPVLLFSLSSINFALSHSLLSIIIPFSRTPSTSSLPLVSLFSLRWAPSFSPYLSPLPSSLPPIFLSYMMLESWTWVKFLFFFSPPALLDFKASIFWLSAIPFFSLPLFHASNSLPRYLFGKGISWWSANQTIGKKKKKKKRKLWNFPLHRKF